MSLSLRRHPKESSIKILLEEWARSRNSNSIALADGPRQGSFGRYRSGDRDEPHASRTGRRLHDGRACSIECFFNNLASDRCSRPAWHLLVSISNVPDV